MRDVPIADQLRSDDDVSSRQGQVELLEREVLPAAEPSSVLCLPSCRSGFFYAKAATGTGGR